MARTTIPPTRPDYTPFPERIAPPGTAEEREQELRMIRTPRFWPYAVLPLKRWYAEKNAYDFAVWDGAHLHDGALWAFGRIQRPAHRVIETTPEALYDLGYRVD